MKNDLNIPPGWWPSLISGTGVLLGGVLLGEVAVVVLSSAAPPAFYIGSVTALPFILGFVYGGYVLSHSELPPERYGDIGQWWVVGMVGAVLLIFPINATIRPLTAKMAVGTVRWSVAVGGGVGLVLGTFQARAVQRAVESERARFSKRRVERQRDKLDEFVGTIAHDLQNPLHVAMGRLELAREECDSDHLDGVARAQDQMEWLIENLLVLARDGTTVETERIDLGSVVETCWQAVETGEARLVTETEGEISADPARLRQLFENLFRSAVRDPGRDLTVTVGSIADGFYVVADDPGVPVDELTVSAGAHTTAESGTGFGLSVVQTIVDAHGWNLAVTESEGGDTRFEVTGVETG